MAEGEEKRTYKITKEAIKKLEILDDKGKLDKSDNVDRAVKIYWRLLRDDKIDDPYVDSSEIGDWEQMVERTDVEDDKQSFFDKLRR